MRRSSKYLRNDPGTDLAANCISDFYTMPVVDISAAVGVATGYFENLVRRALLENGFIGRNGADFRRLIVCRPRNILAHTFEEDMGELRAVLQRELGVNLEEKRFPMIEGFDRRGLVGNFVRDVMIDLPTAAYTLGRSPRFRALQDRVLKAARARRQPALDQIILQASEKLVDQFEDGIRYHVEKETGFRKSALSFSSIRDLPAEIRRLTDV